MKLLTTILLTVILSLSTSCVSFEFTDERAQLRSAQLIYTATVKQVIVLRKAGKISDKDYKNIQEVTSIISLNLDVWNTAIQAGKKRPDMNAILDANLTKLTELIIEYE